MLTAQFSFKEYVEAGDVAMMEAKYFNALTQYSKAIAISKAAYKQNAYNRAEEAFSYYLGNFQGDNQDGALYYLASSQHLKGKYDEAIDNYNLFMTEYGDGVEDKTLLAAVENGLSAAQWAKDQPSSTNGVAVTRMGDDVNSPYSEQGSYLLDDKLYYASMRYPYGGNKSQTLLSKILVN